MILAIDIGNTNIVVGLLENRRILHQIRLKTDSLKTWEEYFFLLQSFVAYRGFTAAHFSGSIVSSVVPALRQTFKRALEELTGKPAWVVGPGLKTGLRILMDNPVTLGSDLVVDAVGGLSLYEPPLVIFDLGTATTMEVLDKDGNYIGGVIAPGLRLGMDALAGRTSSLPNIELKPPTSLIGKNTIHCMQAGAIYGHAALLDGLLDRVEAELGQKVTALATGGLIDQVLPSCKRKIISCPDLTLYGLAVLYEKNQSAATKSAKGGEARV